MGTPWNRLLPFQLGHGQQHVLSQVAGAGGEAFLHQEPARVHDSRWNVSQSPGKVCFQTRPWLSRPVLPPASPSLYRGTPQAGASPAASPGPVRGSQVGLRLWLYTVTSGGFSLPRLQGMEPRTLHVGRYCTGAASHRSPRFVQCCLAC